MERKLIQQCPHTLGVESIDHRLTIFLRRAKVGWYKTKRWRWGGGWYKKGRRMGGGYSCKCLERGSRQVQELGSRPNNSEINWFCRAQASFEWNEIIRRDVTSLGMTSVLPCSINVRMNIMHSRLKSEMPARWVPNLCLTLLIWEHVIIVTLK